jgi:tetratricopeptide (TPR) repeat protein
MSATKWLGLLVAVALIAGCSGNRTENEATALDFFRRGNTAFQKEDYRHAIRMYQQAASLDPRSPAIQYNLGLALYHAQTYSESVQAYSRAVKLDPGMAEAYRNLALAEDRLYNLEAAQTHYNTYQAMMRAREPKGEDNAAASAQPAAQTAAAPKPKPGRTVPLTAAEAARTGAPEPVSQLRRIGKDAHGKEADGNDNAPKSGGDSKWWTQDSSPRNR